MRHRLRSIATLGALIVLITAAPAHAQQVNFPDPAWWPGYFYCGHVDTPNYAPNATTACGYYDPKQTTPIVFNRASDGIAGWIFLCIDGTQPTSVTAKYEDENGIFQPLAVTVYQRLYRPDVYDAYARYCPSVTKSEGYAVYFTDPSTVPLGVHTFHVYQSQNGNTVQRTDSFILDVQ